MKIISLDLDGVLCDPDTFKAMSGAREGVEALRNAGYAIHCHTARLDLAVCERWLKVHNMEMPVSREKQFAHHYVDDHGYHHTSWEQTLKDIL